MLRQLASPETFDFEQAMFRYGQDPHDPYEKAAPISEPEFKAVEKATADGYEELFVRDNIHRLPDDLDEITQSSSLVMTEDVQRKKKKKRRNK